MITTLALVLLFWPLIAKMLAMIRKPKTDDLSAQQPVD